MTKVGVDITAIDRFRKLIDKFGERGVSKFLSSDEIKITKLKVESVAGFWCVKEAFSKAVGTGIGKELKFYDIQIRKDERGKPFIILDDSLKNRLKISDYDVSISHDNGFAISVVVVNLFD